MFNIKHYWMFMFSILLSYLVNKYIIFKTVNRKEMFKFTQKCPKVIDIFSESSVVRWVHLYYDPSYFFSWFQGMFSRGLLFTNLLSGNFWQVIPEAATTSLMTSVVQCSLFWLHSFYPFPTAAKNEQIPGESFT